MVTITQVRQSNAQLSEKTIPQTVLFVGGTSGIGKLTLIELVSLGLPLKAYIVGRKATEAAMKPLLEDLRQKNPSAKLIWVEGEVSLLSETKRICDSIKAKESRLDFLCLTAGYAPFGGRNNTTEGLDVTHSLEYYGRMLFTLHLLPLLRASPAPRVLTVLAGSMLSSKGVLFDDLNLEKPGNFGGMRTQTHMGVMNTLFLDRLAAEPGNDKVTFVHNWPGAVDTGNMARYHTSSTFSPVPLTTLLRPLFLFMGFDEKEAGQRHVYNATSGDLGGDGPRLRDGVEGWRNTRGEEGKRGLFLVNHKCEACDKGNVMKNLRGEAQGKVWEKTMEVLGPYL
ncbi:oxidoreductase lepF [Colletotrichum spaethianum]|uniref:Oxidoreductase lepF n=1 Tax=Colletotrichum spaethianum TaxID=700344 RepID=A0AA37P786_9PEZI|nr:oxidoreductase lepF [Colletotrichum spaethianum]GKT42604.1 oxidoreductase lepF [Colletotrichum spaethianum]